MIRFGCPHCNASMKADEKHAGKLIACKQCGEQITIPESLPPPRRDVPMPAQEAEVAAEEYQPEAYDEAPPVRRPIGAEAVLTTNGDHPPQPLPVETAEEVPATTGPTTDYQPVGRPFGFLSTLLGLAGAGCFAAGVFYPLFLLNHSPIQFEGWLRMLLVQIGGILLGVVALFLVFTKRYGGMWILGPGSLIALIATFGLLFARLKEERGLEIAKTLWPGNGLLLLLGAAALLTLAAILGPRRMRYEYHG